MKRALEGLGGRNIDTRTTLGKAPAQWRVDLVADLGGREAISTQQAASSTWPSRPTLLLNSIDAWLPTQPVTLVDRRRRALIPVVGERQQLAPITYVRRATRPRDPATILQHYACWLPDPSKGRQVE